MRLRIVRIHKCSRQQSLRLHCSAWPFPTLSGSPVATPSFTNVFGDLGRVAAEVERREHRRLLIRLPVDCLPAERDGHEPLRGTTGNISSGGGYFELDVPDGSPPPDPDALLQVELTVPPGDGHFPYEGRLRTVAQVLRTQPLDVPAGTKRGRRYGIAARFRDPLQLAF